MRNRLSRTLAFAILAAAFGSTAFAQLPFQVSDNISTGDEYDLYTVTLPVGSIFGTLVCDRRVSRPLDPTLAVFFPGNTNTDNTSLADVYNDDGFGSDDDPAGVDCDAFDSSRVIFNAPVAGDYVFRADGFGSSIGPYTLTIGVTLLILEVPTLDYVGFAGFALLLVGASFYLSAGSAPPHGPFGSLLTARCAVSPLAIDGAFRFPPARSGRYPVRLSYDLGMTRRTLSALAPLCAAVLFAVALGACESRRDVAPASRALEETSSPAPPDSCDGGSGSRRREGARLCRLGIESGRLLADLATGPRRRLSPPAHRRRTWSRARLRQALARRAKARLS